MPPDQPPVPATAAGRALLERWRTDHGIRPDGTGSLPGFLWREQDRLIADILTIEREAAAQTEALRAAVYREFHAFSPNEWCHDAFDAAWDVALASQPVPSGQLAPVLDVVTLERILPKCLAEADPSESDEGDWIGSEYVMRLADAILAALRQARYERLGR